MQIHLTISDPQLVLLISYPDCFYSYHKSAFHKENLNLSSIVNISFSTHWLNKWLQGDLLRRSKRVQATYSSIKSGFFFLI